MKSLDSLKHAPLTLGFAGYNIITVSIALGLISEAHAAPNYFDLSTYNPASTSKTDIQTGVIIVRSGIVGVPTAGVYNGVSGYAQTGLNLAGNQTDWWWGFGLASTQARAAAQSSVLYGIGVIDNNQPGFGGYLYGPAGIIAPNFANITTLATPLTGAEILVRYSYWGDADLNGLVDGTDYSLIDNGFNSNLSGWLNGDFDYSGSIDGTDYSLIDNAFNSQGAPLFAGEPKSGGSAVPEPATLTLLGMAAVSILSRRRR